MPYVHEWEQSGTLPDDLWTRIADAGILMPTGAGASIPESWRENYPIIGEIPPEEWDGFHDFILHDEFGRIGGIGYVSSCSRPGDPFAALMTCIPSSVSNAVCWEAL